MNLDYILTEYKSSIKPLPRLRVLRMLYKPNHHHHLRTHRNTSHQSNRYQDYESFECYINRTIITIYAPTVPFPTPLSPSLLQYLTTITNFRITYTLPYNLHTSCVRHS
ncbi:hypothetical protein Hdeb2414_s0620g00925471 [Helianthus debilis subsp. tardiflorus]